MNIEIKRWNWKLTEIDSVSTKTVETGKTETEKPLKVLVIEVTMGVTTDELLVSQNSGGGHHSEQLSQQLGPETEIRNCSDKAGFYYCNSSTCLKTTTG